MNTPRLTIKRPALMPFIVGGYPRAGDTTRLLLACQRAGASVVEVGYPFSDPVADGPVIAQAMHTALASGTTPAGVHQEIAAARAQGCTIGIVAMVSVSIVFRVGIKRFIGDAKIAGVDGFIFPDLPLEESDAVLNVVRDAGACASLLIAPTTDDNRAAEIARACSGFVYVLARAGITGTDAALAVDKVRHRVSTLRKSTDLPLAVGFGVSSRDHVNQIVHAAGADAAIVGSAIVKEIQHAMSAGDDPVNAAESFVRTLASGLQPLSQPTR
jgi:tryptophan synthase alpha chain